MLFTTRVEVPSKALTRWPLTRMESRGNSLLPPFRVTSMVTVLSTGPPATTRFRYGRSTDLNLVVMNQTPPDYAASWVGSNGANQWVQPMLPSPVWVVKNMEVRASPGVTPSITSYLYKDPVFAGSAPFNE